MDDAPFDSLPATQRVNITHDHLKSNLTALSKFKVHVNLLWAQRRQLLERVNGFEAEAQLPQTPLIDLPEPVDLTSVLTKFREAILEYGDPMLECGFNTLLAHLEKQTAVTQRAHKSIDELTKKYESLAEQGHSHPVDPAPPLRPPNLRWGNHERDEE